MEVTSLHLLMAVASAFLVGFAKAGMPGLGVLLVPLMAAAVGPGEAPGVLLPVLLLGDVIAVWRYRRHVNWGVALRLLPWVLPGVYVGGTVLARLRESGQGGAIASILGVMVLALVLFRVVSGYLGTWFEEKLPHTWWFSLVMGLLAGFATGLAHMAGPVMTIYFLSRNLKKHAFMGSAAVFFLIVNASKLPLYIPQGTLSQEHFAMGLKVIAAVPVGALLGILLFNVIPQRLFNRVVLILAAVAGVRLLLG